MAVAGSRLHAGKEGPPLLLPGRKTDRSCAHQNRSDPMHHGGCQRQHIGRIRERDREAERGRGFWCKRIPDRRRGEDIASGGLERLKQNQSQESHASFSAHLARVSGAWLSPTTTQPHVLSSKSSGLHPGLKSYNVPRFNTKRTL